MKRQFKPATGLLITMSVGFVIDVILWITYYGFIAPIWFTMAFVVAYLHIRWLKKVNKDKDDVKIKRLI